MFQQAGLRFDQDFLNRTFFSGNGFIFQFYSTPQGSRQTVYRSGSANGNITQNRDGLLNDIPPEYLNANAPPGKPGFFDRLELKMVNWFTRLTLRMLFGVRVETPKPGIDRRQSSNYPRLKPRKASRKP